MMVPNPSSSASTPAPGHQNSLQRSAPGKLNLFLEVLGRRDDGFHDLETVMVRCSLHDSIQFKFRNDRQINLSLLPGSVDADRFPLDKSNLIMQAAAAVRQAAKLNTGADIRILKRIPAAAGLAGGSSNAATTLLALNELWQARLSITQLHQIAADLGSDINFFVADCQAARCTGRGEIVQPLAWNRTLHALVARPAAGNPTPDVFRQLQLPEQPVPSDRLLAALSAAPAGDLADLAFNRLTTAARQINPQMVELMRQLETCTGRPVQMSGSGSTCFVLTSSREQAQRWLLRLQPTQPHFATIVDL